MSVALLSRTARFAGRLLRLLIVLFLLLDAVAHVLVPAPVMDAFARIGFPVHLSVAIGVLAAACLVLYVVPRTAVVWAILLTGYLGGATAIQLRAASPSFEVAFPVLCGVLVWCGLLLARPDARSTILGTKVRMVAS
jgi:hypothetical protein